jgi:hypothetical protein
VTNRLEIEGPIAAVTAGWQEREDEDEELRDHLGGRTLNLKLHQRAEVVFREDPDLFSLYRIHQNRLKEIRELYQLRLSYAMDAARELQSHARNSSYLESETEAAIEDIRHLDRHHLQPVPEVQAEFMKDSRLPERPSVAQQRVEIGRLLSSCGALAIAGGHVAVLLNRLRLFSLIDMLETQTVLAWSAGAMVLSPQIVVFHDSPPQGAGNAEALDSGLNLFSGLLPLPHARRRLLLSDPLRVALMSRRFESLRCVPLDEGSELIMTADQWTPMAPAVQLSEDGSLTELVAPWRTRSPKS